MRKLIFDNHFNYDFIKRMIRWHIKYYFFGKGSPINAGVYITDACNSRCIMCDIWKTKNTSIYPRHEQEQAIDELSRVGCYYYSVSGGEPTLIKDLPDRLAYAARKIPYVHLVTNGLSMTAELARAIGSSGIKEISISIDGSEKLHNTLRGLPNAYDKTWSALDIILTYAPKIHVVVNSLLTPYSLDSLRALGDQLSVFPHVHQKYLPLSYHELFRNENRKSLSFMWEAASASEIKKFLEDARKMTRIVNSTIFLKMAENYFNGEQNQVLKQHFCLYPFHSIEFDSKGFAYPCITGMNFKKGIPPGSNLKKHLKSLDHCNLQKKLKECRKCKSTMMLCYYEPRLNFPLHNLFTGFLTSRFSKLN